MVNICKFKLVNLFVEIEIDRFNNYIYNLFKIVEDIDKTRIWCICLFSSPIK